MEDTAGLNIRPVNLYYNDGKGNSESESRPMGYGTAVIDRRKPTYEITIYCDTVTMPGEGVIEVEILRFSLPQNTSKWIPGTLEYWDDKGDEVTDATFRWDKASGKCWLHRDYDGKSWPAGATLTMPKGVLLDAP